MSQCRLELNEHLLRRATTRAHILGVLHHLIVQLLADANARAPRGQVARMPVERAELTLEELNDLVRGSCRLHTNVSWNRCVAAAAAPVGRAR